MSDDMVKRLRDSTSWYHGDCELKMNCADRIKELEAEVAEQIEWVRRLADDLIAAEGREARLKEKLAKVIILAGDMAEAIEDQIDTCDASMDEQIAVKNYRTTLAELTGGKDE